MIQKIRIENFRCFEQFELDGFSRVNLFGGMNNVGKTALMEGVYLGDTWFGTNVDSVFAFRNEEKKNLLLEIMPFRSLFGDMNSAIKISTQHDNRNRDAYYYFRHQNLQDEKAQAKKIAGNAEDFVNLFSLELWGQETVVTPKAYSIKFPNNKEDAISPFEAKLNRGQVINFVPGALHFFKNDVFEQFKSDEKIDQTIGYLEILRVIDKTIKEIRTTADDNRIQIKKDGYIGLLPLNYLGDAVGKAISYFAFLQRAGTEVLLIDEIENGLHYTKQEEFWKMIFVLAKERNIQIFATTHSLEMIKAFNKVAIENKWEEEAMYFEMYRHPETNHIEASQLDSNLVEYRLKMGKHLRG